MPLRQYIVLKRAVSIESIASRRVHIQDVNRAFHDPTPLMKQLEKDLLSLLHKSDKESVGAVNWGKDKDWKSQLSKYKV